MMETLIKDIRPGMKNLNVVFIILDIGNPILTKENREVRSCKVADSTACINVSIWDEPGQFLSPGDIVRITRGYASVFRDSLTLYTGKSGDMQKIGEFCMVFNESLNMSEPNQQQQPVYHGPTANNILVSNGPNTPPVNNGGRPNSGPSSASSSLSTPGSSHSASSSHNKPLPLNSSALFNSEGGNGGKGGQSSRNTSRGRGSGPRR